jgi:hypothetical protein
MFWMSHGTISSHVASVIYALTFENTLEPAGAPFDRSHASEPNVAVKPAENLPLLLASK